jgi:hypothetical protein
MAAFNVKTKKFAYTAGLAVLKNTSTNYAEDSFCGKFYYKCAVKLPELQSNA